MQLSLSVTRWQSEWHATRQLHRFFVPTQLRQMRFIALWNSWLGVFSGSITITLNYFVKKNRGKNISNLIKKIAGSWNNITLVCSWQAQRVLSYVSNFRVSRRQFLLLSIWANILHVTNRLPCQPKRKQFTTYSTYSNPRVVWTIIPRLDRHVNILIAICFLLKNVTRIDPFSLRESLCWQNKSVK